MFRILGTPKCGLYSGLPNELPGLTKFDNNRSCSEHDNTSVIVSNLAYDVILGRSFLGHDFVLAGDESDGVSRCVSSRFILSWAVKTRWLVIKKDSCDR